MLPVRFSLPLNWSDKRGNLCCLTFTGLLGQTLLLWEIHYGQAEFVPLAFPMLKHSRGHGTKRSPRRIARICKAFGKTFTLSALLSMLNAELLLRVQPGPRCINEAALGTAEKRLSAQITRGEILDFSSASHKWQAEGEKVFLSEMLSVKSFPEIRFFFQIPLLGDRICKTELID